MKNSIFTRNLIRSAGMVLLSILVLSLLFSVVSYTYVIQDRRKMLTSTANVVADVASAMGQVSELGNWEIGLQAVSVSRATGFHVFLCDESGQVLVCSDALTECRHIGEAIASDILMQVERNGNLNLRSDLDGFYEEKRYVAAVPIVLEGSSPAGYVFAAAENGMAGSMWRIFTLILVFTGCFVLLITIPLSVIDSRKEAAPLKEMAAAARQFGKGDMQARVKSPGRTDEVGELCEAFNQMADALERSENNRKDFIAAVSHELKTPMTTISGFADSLLDGTIPMEEAPRYLTVISDETKRLNRLVRQMLDISRMKAAPQKSAEPGEFDAAEMLRRNILNLAGRIEARGLELCPELPEDALPVRGSEDEVGRVFYNILDNAVKFAAPGTALDVRLFKKGNKAFVSVVDRGETIPEAELPEIFQRFHKSDRSRSMDRDGVGLGLYIVKTILDGMGEDIWVRSRDGETEFRFSLTLV